ncbi:hypothetical protein NliqN6_3224 [Naganishia liquefaciens]|uniref:Flavodoxin-like domain-containing protein n=1 Tax=Naganishia liquefaciens TaxID=104408 RepID=A0A8H3TTC7_9TREE|nr:hypothetical protein NliqN6_3224 [Naganishia liquefaciens]
MSGITEGTSNLNISAPKAKIGVIFYSTYGHITQLAEKIVEGVKAAGAEPVVYQIQETLSEEILGKMHGGSSLKPKYPVVTPNDLKELDGFLFGFPTRYGRAPAQVAAFFDATGGLWATGALIGKFGGVFTSTAGQHGGQETTALTTVPFFVHHGISFVPLGYANQGLSKLDAVHGGSPYGAATIANSDGSRQPDEVELDIAVYHGKTFAEHVSTFVRGKHAQARDAAHPTANVTAAKTDLAALNLGAPIGTTTAAPASDATAVKPVEPTRDVQEGGYQVEETPVKSAASPAAVPVAASTASAPTKETETRAAEPATAAPAEKITATEKPANAPQTVPAAAATTSKPTTAPKKKKGGLFASCCGKSDHIE